MSSSPASHQGSLRASGRRITAQGWFCASLKKGAWVLGPITKHGLNPLVLRLGLGPQKKRGHGPPPIFGLANQTKTKKIYGKRHRPPLLWGNLHKKKINKKIYIYEERVLGYHSRKEKNEVLLLWTSWLLARHLLRQLSSTWRLGGLLPYATIPRYSKVSQLLSDSDLSSPQPRTLPHPRD